MKTKTDKPDTRQGIRPEAGSAKPDPEQRKRGRPKGSRNKVKISRPDKAEQMEPGENTKYILHDMKLSSLPDIDINNPEQLQGRISKYFSICAEDDIKPSIASLALALGVSRFTLFDLVTGRNKRLTNPDCLHTLKKAYNSITSYYEHLMNNGKINPVAGIFMMKNNMGYTDTNTIAITGNNEQQLSLSDVTSRAGLLTDE